jgi:hypothetical protein
MTGARSLADVSSPEPWLRHAKILVPGTLVASVFYYLGLRYTDYQYRQYGIDDSALDFSTTNYMYRSINVASPPAITVAAAIVVALALHLALSGTLRLVSNRSPRLHRRVTTGTGLTIVTGGVVAMLIFPSHGASDSVRRAIAWLLCIVLIAYGAWLTTRHAPGSLRAATITSYVADGSERRALRALFSLAIGLLATYGVFNLASVYALDRAYHMSLYIQAHPSLYPLVRIYSTYDLALDDEAGVSEHRLSVVTSQGFRFRYDDLRLFLEDNGHVVVWPANRSPRRGMLIIADGDNIRVEYVRG